MQTRKAFVAGFSWGTFADKRCTMVWRRALREDLSNSDIHRGFLLSKAQEKKAG